MKSEVLEKDEFEKEKSPKNTILEFLNGQDFNTGMRI